MGRGRNENEHKASHVTVEVTEEMGVDLGTELTMVPMEDMGMIFVVGLLSAVCVEQEECYPLNPMTYIMPLEGKEARETREICPDSRPGKQHSTTDKKDS